MKYYIKNSSGDYWTGECWGVVEVKAEIDHGDLFWQYLDVDCHPGTFFDNGSADVGWGNEQGEIFARAYLVG